MRSARVSIWRRLVSLSGYSAQSYWPFGTTVHATVVPEGQAVELPDGVSDELLGSDDFLTTPSSRRPVT